jgi:NAD(P)-dependent dehydrogenase (short-subunit alcohol dehydrogenase family)
MNTAAPKKDRYLDGRVALVTAGGSGIGRAVALALAEAGAAIALGTRPRAGSQAGELCYAPTADEVASAQEHIEALGARCFVAELDVANSDSVWSFVDRAEKTLGPVDVVVNAASVGAEQTVVGHPEALWQRVMEVNLNGTYRTVRRCLPGMIERRWGRVVNIASTSASTGSATRPAFASSKAGVVAFTRCVALEGAPFGVTCNTISPGWVETPFGREWMTHIAEMRVGVSGDAFMAEQKADNPQGRMIQPLEIGAYCAFLCRDEAIGITGQDLTVSAGALL